MTEVLERDSAVPLYQQLERILRAKIDSGEWTPGQRMPSENELNRMYGLSRMTVRGVLNTLAADGVITRVAGKGTFVAPREKISAVSPAYRGVREQLEAQGYDTTTVLVSIDEITAPADVRRGLTLPEGGRVHAIVRLRSAAGMPLSIHRSFVPVSMAPTLPQHDVVNEQLCVVLEENFDLPMSAVEETLEAVAADSEESRALDVRTGSPLLRLVDIVRDARGIPFEFSQIVFRGDRIKLRFDYSPR